MSSTRHQTEGGPLRQEKWMSSPAYDRGLLAHLVAERCSKIESPADRELIWFLQRLSWCEQRMYGLASEIIARHGGQLGILLEVWGELARAELAKELAELCLNPETDMERVPSCFAGLSGVLREFKAEHERRAAESVAVTANGRKIYEALDYVSESGCFTLIFGNCGRSKSFSSRAWCAGRSGRARYIVVPPTNDEHSFLLVVAAEIGLSINLKSKAFELRERIEQALAGGDLMLVFDEASRLWPLKNLRDNTPLRIAWVMSLADRGVPVALIVTPQFFQAKDRAQAACGWNSDQFFRRFRQVVEVPDAITPDDLRAVCDSLLPSADAKLRASIVGAVKALPQPLDLLDAIAKRAASLASKAGQAVPANAHVAESFQFAMRSETTLARLTAPAKRRGMAGVLAQSAGPVARATPAPRDARADAPRADGALEFSDRNLRTVALPDAMESA